MASKCPSFFLLVWLLTCVSTHFSLFTVNADCKLQHSNPNRDHQVQYFWIMINIWHSFLVLADLAFHPQLREGGDIWTICRMLPVWHPNYSEKARGQFEPKHLSCGSVLAHFIGHSGHGPASSSHISFLFGISLISSLHIMMVWEVA